MSCYFLLVFQNENSLKLKNQKSIFFSTLTLTSNELIIQHVYSSRFVITPRDDWLKQFVHIFLCFSWFSHVRCFNALRNFRNMCRADIANRILKRESLLFLKVVETLNERISTQSFMVPRDGKGNSFLFIAIMIHCCVLLSTVQRSLCIDGVKLLQEFRCCETVGVWDESKGFQAWAE